MFSKKLPTPIVKLDATSSTNDFLKEMAGAQETENFTVVTAESQSKGRGQMGTSWVSEKGKNLMMSMLVKDCLSDVSQIFTLNVAIAMAVISALETYEIPELSIKWPNDIMAGNKKIGGVLIENSIKPDGIVSIVGIGLNVNQTDFSLLPKASSIAVAMNRVFDKDELLDKIIQNIRSNVDLIHKNPDGLWHDYHIRLFKKDIPMAFEDNSGNRFMGIIRGVNQSGKLELLLEDDTTQSFEIKEIQMLY